MNQRSQNYFLGTLTKTPLKVYLTGSTLHVTISETLLVLTLLIRSPGLNDADVLASLLTRAVLIYVPAHEPARLS